jgi:hypothetical protein
MTGTTTISEDDGDEAHRRVRTLSTMSNSEQDPLWRANVGGDYDQRQPLLCPRDCSRPDNVVI